jgi:hypothetical protein
LLLLLGMWWMALPGRACERPTLTHMLFLSAWLGARCTVPESKTAKALCRKLPKRVAVIFSDAQKQAKPGRAAKRKQCRAWGRGGKPLSVLWKGSRSGSSGAADGFARARCLSGCFHSANGRQENVGTGHNATWHRQGSAATCSALELPVSCRRATRIGISLGRPSSRACKSPEPTQRKMPVLPSSKGNSCSTEVLSTNPSAYGRSYPGRARAQKLLVAIWSGEPSPPRELRANHVCLLKRQRHAARER